MALSVDELQQELDRLRGAASGAATGVSQFAGALAGQAGGLGNFNRMLQSGSQTLGGLIKNVAGGEVAAAALEALSKGLGVSLDQTDRLNRAYQTLGNTGQSLGETQQSLRKQGDRFGLAIGLNEEAAQKFTKILQANSKDLARLGGTAVMGSKRLGEAFEAMGPVRVALQNIGIAYEDQIEGLADYTRMQTATGRAQQMSTTQLAQGAADYLRKLQDLAAITGVSRQEQQKAREAALAEQRYGAMMIAEEQRAQALERQGRTAEAAAVRKNMESLQEFTGVVSGMDEELAKGLRDLAAGAIGTDEAKKAARTLGGDAQAIVSGLKKGTMSSAEALQRLGRASERHVNSTVKLAQISGQYGQTYTSITKANKIAQLAQNDIAQRALETEKLREKTEKQRETDVAKTAIVSNQVRQAQLEAGKIIEGTQEAALAAASAIGTKLVELLPDLVEEFNALAQGLTGTITQSQNFGDVVGGIADSLGGLIGRKPASEVDVGGAVTPGRVIEGLGEKLRDLSTPTAPPAPAEGDKVRLPADQVSALQDTKAKLPDNQLASLRPVTLPAQQNVKISPDQIRELQPPRLATPGLMADQADRVRDQDRLRAQAADITKKYADLAGNLKPDLANRTGNEAGLARDFANMPRIDLARLGDVTTNQPNIMRVKMPELAMPASPQAEQKQDQSQQARTNAQELMDQFNSRPQANDLEPLLAVMTDMLNVQRQQSATMNKMLQVQRA